MKKGTCFAVVDSVTDLDYQIISGIVENYAAEKTYEQLINLLKKYIVQPNAGHYVTLGHLIGVIAATYQEQQIIKNQLSLCQRQN